MNENVNTESSNVTNENKSASDIADDILLSAFDYALGRKTYIVDSIASVIERVGGRLSKDRRDYIIGKVEEEYSGQSNDDIDRTRWTDMSNKLKGMPYGHDGDNVGIVDILRIWRSFVGYTDMMLTLVSAFRYDLMGHGRTSVEKYKTIFTSLDLDGKWRANVMMDIEDAYNDRDSGVFSSAYNAESDELDSLYADLWDNTDDTNKPLHRGKDYVCYLVSIGVLDATYDNADDTVQATI